MTSKPLALSEPAYGAAAKQRALDYRHRLGAQGVSNAEQHANASRFWRALSVDCGGKPLLWRSASIIAARAAIRNPADVKRAITYARSQGWLDVDGAHNVCLTLKGSRAA